MDSEDNYRGINWGCFFIAIFIAVVSLILAYFVITGIYYLISLLKI